MSTAELKIVLINQITSITDKVKLEELLELMKFQNDESLYITNEVEKQAILEAQQQISNGETYSNEDIQAEIKEWLNKEHDIYQFRNHTLLYLLIFFSIFI
jgi:hypothetical protein